MKIKKSTIWGLVVLFLTLSIALYVNYFIKNSPSLYNLTFFGLWLLLPLGLGNCSIMPAVLDTMSSCPSFAFIGVTIDLLFVFGIPLFVFLILERKEYKNL
jgi:hypothetical protein